MHDVEFIIKQVDATMKMEDMPLKQEDKDRIRDCITDDKKYEKMLKLLIQRHSNKQEKKYGHGL